MTRDRPRLRALRHDRPSRMAPPTIGSHREAFFENPEAAAGANVRRKPKYRDLSITDEDLSMRDEDLSITDEDLSMQSRDLSITDEDLSMRDEDLSMRDEDLSITDEDLSM